MYYTMFGVIHKKNLQIPLESISCAHWTDESKISISLNDSNPLILPPSTKEYNYGIRAGQTSSSLTKFIVNSIMPRLDHWN